MSTTISAALFAPLLDSSAEMPVAICSGPVSEFSRLGQFLKDIANVNLDSNRWASLLPAEKAALAEVAGPIGVAEGDHDWDFGFRYMWAEFELSDEAHLTAEREVSYRHWSAGAQVQGFKVRIPFSMPHRGDFAAEIGIGRDGDHMIGSEGDRQMEWVPDPQPDSESSWGGKGAKLLVFAPWSCRVMFF